MRRSVPANWCSREVAGSEWGTVTHGNAVLGPDRIRLRSDMMWSVSVGYVPERRSWSRHFCASPGLMRRDSSRAPRSAAMASWCANAGKLDKGAIRGRSTGAAATRPLPGRCQTATSDRAGPLPIRHQTATEPLPQSASPLPCIAGPADPFFPAIMRGNGPWLRTASQLEMREGAAQPPGFRY